MHLPHHQTTIILKVVPRVTGYGRYIFCSMLFYQMNLTLTFQALKCLKNAPGCKWGVIWDAEEINSGKVVKRGVAENLAFIYTHCPESVARAAADQNAKRYGVHDLGLSVLLKCIMVIVFEAGVKDYSFTFST